MIKVAALLALLLAACASEPAPKKGVCDHPVGKPEVVTHALAGTSMTAEFIRIPAGCAWMGCNPAVDQPCREDQTGRLVHLPAYDIMRTEATIAQWQLCVDLGRCHPTVPGLGGYNDGVCWTKPELPFCVQRGPDYVERFCEAMFEGGRLATELEWEKAARGGCETQTGDCAKTARTYVWGMAPDACEVSLGFDCTAVSDDITADPSTWHLMRSFYKASGFGDDCLMRLHYVRVPGTTPIDRSPYGVLDMGANLPEVVTSAEDGAVLVRGPGPLRAPDLARELYPHWAMERGGGAMREDYRVIGRDRSHGGIDGEALGARCVVPGLVK